MVQRTRYGSRRCSGNLTFPEEEEIPMDIMANSIVKGKTKRKDYIDVLRAFALFFVILGHQMKGVTPYFVFTSPVKIPLFFVITGYVFNYSRTSTTAFFKNLFWKLIVPWLCLTIPFAFLKVPFKGTSALLTELYEIISGVTSWYMPCCIVAEIIWFFVCKYGKTKWRIAVVSVALCLLGIAFSSRNILEFAMINNALVAQYWILLGFLIRSYEDKLARIKRPYILGMFLLFLGMGFATLKLWPGSCIDVHKHTYYNYPFCFAMITLGCLTVFLAARMLGSRQKFAFPRFLLFLGQNTLVFYLLHGFDVLALTWVLSKAHIELTMPILVCAKVLFAYIACTIETLIILRFFPWVLGKRAVTRQH